MVEQSLAENDGSKDFMNIAQMPEFRSIIGSETVILSSQLQQKSYIFFTKSKFIFLTETRIIQASFQKKQVRFVNHYADLLGVTKSLRLDANNFIMHFGQRADEEYMCDHRDELISMLAIQHEAVEGRPLQVFGLSSATLDDYLTTERDLANKITRMPTSAFLLNRRETLIMDKKEGDAENWEEAIEDEMFDEFVVLQPPDMQKYNTTENLSKERDQQKQGQSSCLIGKPGLQGEQVNLEDFEISKVIDKGSFGKVFLVSNRKMGKMYAMKRINKDLLLQKKQVQNIKNEKEILFQADHPFVNSMDFVFQNELKIYFFLKYLPGGNIYDNIYKVRRFQEGTVKFIGAQIVSALGYLHGRNIVHRDLKPENVLMDYDGYVSLADFGLAKFLQPKDQTFSFCGTAEYLAPEILDMRGHGFGVDWWTLGILLYEMATGRPPFLNKSHHKLGILIRTGRIVFPDPEKHQIFMSDELKDVITRLLDRDQSTRLGNNGDAAEVKAHPFFADINWTALENREIDAEYKPQISNEQKEQESMLLSPNGSGQDGDNNQAALGSPSKMGHSILEEDAKDEVTAQQVEFVRQHQHQFQNF